jgi:hypothetical protein
MTELKSLKLNNPCPICNKPIFINEEAVNTKKGIYHLECYLNGYRLELEQEFYLDKQPRAIAKLIEMALDTQKEKFIKEFDFELDNKVISYETLEKLDKIKKSIKNNSQEQMGKSELTTMNLSEKTINNGDVESPSNSSHTLDTRKGCGKIVKISRSIGKTGKIDTETNCGNVLFINGINYGLILCPECLKNNSQVNENNNSCKSSVYADNLDIPEEKTTADLFLDAEKTYLKYSEEQDLCKNCGHSKKYHHTIGVGLPAKYIDECRAKGRDGAYWERCKCECKKFEPMEKKK